MCPFHWYMSIDPTWKLTKDDEFDYMTSIVRITQGGVDGVLDTLDGCNPRKQWESMDCDRKFLSYDTLMDGKKWAWFSITCIICSLVRFSKGNPLAPSNNSDD